MSEMNPPVPQYPVSQYPPNTVFTPRGPMIAMSVGQILERVLRLLRVNLGAFVGIGALPFLVIFGTYGIILGALFGSGLLPNLANFPGSSGIPHGERFIGIFGLCYVLLIPVWLFFYGLYYGASTYAAVQADQGLKVTAMESFRHGWSRIGGYTWLLLVRSLIIVLPIFVFAMIAGVVVLALGLNPSKEAGTAAMFILIPLVVLCYLGFFVYAILMMLRFSLAFPACMHEGIGAWDSIKRSGVLTNGAKGRIFLVLLVIYAISYAVMMVVYMFGFFAFGIVMAVGGNKLQDPSPLTIAFLVIAGLIALVLILLFSALLMGAYSIAFAVFYRDQLLRQEGLLPKQVLRPGEAIA
jgi:hypothetical protein